LERFNPWSDWHLAGFQQHIGQSWMTLHETGFSRNGDAKALTQKLPFPSANP